MCFKIFNISSMKCLHYVFDTNLLEKIHRNILTKTKIVIKNKLRFTDKTNK